MTVRRIRAGLSVLVLLLAAGSSRADDRPPVAVGDIVEAVVSDTPVKSGDQVIETIQVCERFQVLAVDGESVRIRARGKEGLVPLNTTRVVPEIEVGDLVEVTAETSPVKWDDEVRARVKKGDELIVTALHPRLLRVRVDGKVGWVARTDVREVRKSIPALRAERKIRHQGQSEAKDDEDWLENVKRIIAIDRQQLHPIGGDRPDVEAESRAVMHNYLIETAKWLPRLIRSRDEPLYEVDISLNVCAARREMHGSADWRTINANIALDRAIRRWQSTAEQRRQLDEADVWTKNSAARYDKGEKEEAFEDLVNALKIRRELLPGSYDVSATINNLGTLHVRNGNRGEAEKHYAQSAKLRRHLLGDDHPYLAFSLHNLAGEQHKLARYGEARVNFEEAIRIRTLAFGEESAARAESLYGLGETHIAEGNSSMALPLYREIVEIRRKLLGTEHSAYANALTNLGLLYVDLGEYTRARPFLEEALELHRKHRGEEHGDYAAALNNVAIMQLNQGDHEAAMRTLLESTKVTGKAHGLGHPTHALSLHNLGYASAMLGQNEAALKCYEAALLIRRRTIGEEHPHYGLTLNNLAHLHVVMGELDKAEPLYQQYLEITAKGQGEDHPDYALALHNLAHLQECRGDLAAAKSLNERSLSIRLTRQRVDHPLVLLSMDQLAHTHAALGEWDDAARMYDRERRGVRRHTVRVLRGLSPEKQLQFLLQKDRGAYLSCLSLGLKRRDDPRVAELSASWLLNGKAVAVESLARSMVLARELDGPSAVDLVEELRRARDGLARESLRIFADDAGSNRRVRLAELQANVDRLVRQLGGLGTNNVADDPWVELSQIREGVPAYGALIELARMELADFTKTSSGAERWSAPRYVAWIMPREGAVKIVDLGEAEPIDAAVTAARSALEKSPAVVRDQGEEVAEKAVLEPLKALSSMILEPLLAEIGDDVERLIIGPDGALCLVPWAALPLVDGRYAVERYEIGYVVSGRDLVARSEYRGEVAAPLILADPDFERAPADVRTADTAELRGAEGTYGTLPRVKRLPATAAEARAIQPGMTALAGAEPVTYLGAEATEEVFKRTAHPAVLSLSTHGFFLKDREKKTPDEEATDEATPSAADSVLANPLLRCGLFLAGSNQRHRAADGLDDGILTGSEIVGTDLRGTKLVVLSACETGVGEVRSGEGVAGLRQAFQLAGAESVVSSLWHVDDLATARLMQGFFKNLAEPNTRRTAALRQSQLDRIASRRDRYGAAHPFYWAAFTLTGKVE